MDTAQADLLPFASPETLLAVLRNLERRVLTVSPELTDGECLALLGELALTGLQFDRIERRVYATSEYRNRQTATTPVIPLRVIEPLRRRRPARARLHSVR